MSRKPNVLKSSNRTRKFLPNSGRNVPNTYPKTPRVDIGVQTAPVSAGFSLPPSFIKRVSDKAQQLTDIAGMSDNERITFTDIYSINVSTGASGNGLFQGTSTNTDAILSPNNISARLSQITSIYQYYAFRELCITYIPAVSTATAGMLSFGVYQDADNLTITPTFQQVLEMSPSMTCSCWGTSSMTYRHTGTKIWETTNNSSAPQDNFMQAVLFGVGFNTAASTVYGKIHVAGIMDVYKTSFILTGVVSPFIDKRKLEIERERYNRFLRFEAAEAAEKKEKLVQSEKKDLQKSLLLDLDTDHDEESLEDLRESSGFSAADIEQLIELSKSLRPK
jgi:hypothetical protein